MQGSDETYEAWWLRAGHSRRGQGLQVGECCRNKLVTQVQPLQDFHGAEGGSLQVVGRWCHSPSQIPARGRKYRQVLACVGPCDKPRCGSLPRGSRKYPTGLDCTEDRCGPKCCRWCQARADGAGSKAPPAAVAAEGRHRGVMGLIYLKHRLGYILCTEHQGCPTATPCAVPRPRPMGRGVPCCTPVQRQCATCRVYLGM